MDAISRLRDARHLLCMLCLIVAGLVGGCACSSQDQKWGTAQDEAAASPRKEKAGNSHTDDICAGFRASVGWQHPLGDAVHPSARDDMRKRDARMRQLKDLLSSLPPSARVECLVIDVYQESHGQLRSYDLACLYWGDGMPASLLTEMARLGFGQTNQTQWRAMRPWVQEATDKREGPLMEDGSISDNVEVVVFSFYDGARWHIEPWFYLTYAFAGRRELVPADVAIVRLFAYLRHEVQLGLASRYPAATFEVFLGDWEEVLAKRRSERRGRGEVTD